MLFQRFVAHVSKALESGERTALTYGYCDRASAATEKQTNRYK